MEFHQVQKKKKRKLTTLIDTVGSALEKSNAWIRLIVKESPSM